MFMQSTENDVAYPLRIRRRHYGAKDGEVVIHLSPAVPLHRDMSHPLPLDLFTSLAGFRPLPLVLALALRFKIFDCRVQCFLLFKLHHISAKSKMFNECVCVCVVLM